MKKLVMIAFVLFVTVMVFAEIDITALEGIEGSISGIIEDVKKGNNDLALDKITKLRNTLSKTEANLRGLNFRGGKCSSKCLLMTHTIFILKN